MFNFFKKSKKQPDIIGEVVEKIMMPVVYDADLEKALNETFRPAFVADDAPDITDDSGVLNIDILRYYARANYRLTPQIQEELIKYWAINRACLMPVQDCLRNGYELVAEAQEQVPDEAIKAIAKFNKEFNFNQLLEDTLFYSRVYGIRVCIFQFEGLTSEHYENPINWETLKNYKYKGFFALSPQYCIPVQFEMNDPMRFRQVNYWKAANQKYHYSWVRLVHHTEVAANLLPQYLGGGVSLVQEIYEKVYQADQAANEALQILFTKNLTVRKGDVQSALLNQAEFEQKMSFFARMTGQFRQLFLSTDEDYQNIERSLQGVEDLFAKYYEIVAAVAKIPNNRFMMTQLTGFAASGEAEDRIYNSSNLSTLQVKLNPLIEMHNKAILVTNGLDHENITIEWNKCGALTEAELADIQGKRIANDVQLVQSQIIAPDKAAERLAKDKDSGYAHIDLTQPEMGNNPLEGLDFSMFAQPQQIEQKQPIDALKDIHNQFGGQQSAAIMQEYLNAHGVSQTQDSKGWIGVDLDGTLAIYDGWKGVEHIGEPIPEMLNRVKEWIENGQQVKIFTARASDKKAIPFVHQWLKNNGLPDLEITNVKDFDMIQLWDDRAIQVMENTGNPVESESQTADKSASPEQARFMAAAAHNPEFAEKAGIQQSVAREFNKADTQDSEPLKAGDVINLNGYNVLIENPKGSVRTWTDQTGRSGESVLTCHYGELHGFTGADDDYLDVFIVD